MTRSVYLIGGAGAGKSTFMAQLLDLVCMRYGPLEDLHSKRNVKNLVTLRGHRMHGYDGETGLYLGCMRESFPGTDGLDRATSPVGAEWLAQGDLPSWIVGEGATLATRPFLTALGMTTDLLLVHLECDPAVKVERFAERGSNQAPSFVQATTTRAANLARDMRAGLTVDTDDPWAWDAALDLVKIHLHKD